MKKVPPGVSSISDSEKMKFLAMYEQMKNIPGFADSFKAKSEPVKKDSTSIRTEETLMHRETPELSLKATPIEEDDEMLKNNFITEERSRSAASQSNFYEASSLLDEMDSDNEPDIGIELLNAECYIQLGRETKAEKSLKRIEEILKLPPMCDVDDVIALADGFAGNSDNLRALLLLRIAGDMYQESQLTPDEKVGGLFRCIRKMQDPIENMLNPKSSSSSNDAGGLQGLLERLLKPLKGISSGEEPDLDAAKILNQQDNKKSVKNERAQVIAFDYGVTVSKEMLDDLRAVDGADPENKALKQAILANNINSHYSATNQHTKAVVMLTIGAEQLEKQFGKNANQFRIYSTLLNNIGVELHNSEKYKEAEKMKIKSLEAKDFALDYNNEEEKSADIKVVRESLRITRTHLKLA